MLPRCGYVVSGFSRTTCIKQLNRGVERCGAEMHVPLRHAELAVSGELLDGPCRRATHRQVRTECVAKDVDAVPHVRVFRGELHFRLHDLPGERLAVRFAQDSEAAQVAVLSKSCRQTNRQRDVAKPTALRRGHFTIPIRSLDAQLTLGKVDIAPLERHHLAAA